MYFLDVVLQHHSLFLELSLDVVSSCVGLIGHFQHRPYRLILVGELGVDVRHLSLRCPAPIPHLTKSNYYYLIIWQMHQWHKSSIRSQNIKNI